MATAELPKLLMVASEPGELVGILRRCRAVKRLRWPVWFARSAELNGHSVLLVANGPGSKLAASAVRAAAERSRPEAVLSTGYCGATDPELVPGDVIVATRVEDGASTYAGSVPGTAGQQFRTGTLFSLNHVVRTLAEKARLRERGALAVDMESGAVALEACRNRMKYYCIRAVLDGAQEGFDLDFDALRDADGRYDRTRILKAALDRPVARVPELVRLQRRAIKARRALGEFLGNCQF
jgi:nucleoside phosphorylase